MGAVRFQVIGKVDGVPRVVLEHVTRTDARTRCPSGRSRPEGGRLLPDRDHRRADDAASTSRHHGEHGDHNVSGMIITAQRLVNAVPAVVAAEPGLVTALDLPLVTGRGLVERRVSILDRFAAHRPRRRRHRRRPRASAPPPRSRSPRRAPTCVISSRTERPARQGRRAGSARPGRRALVVRPTSATPTRSPASPRRRTTSSAGSTPSSTTSAAPSPTRSSTPTSPTSSEAFHFNVSTAHALTRGRGAADARRRPGRRAEVDRHASAR